MTSLNACLRFVARFWALIATIAIVGCDSHGDTDDDHEHLGIVVQGIDTDSDGLDDGWETSHFGNLAQTASGDFDSDEMTNLEEYVNGFNPTVKDAFDDADGDRYPNIFEIRFNSDPNASSSIPTPTYVVNGAGGGTHTSVSAAVSASSTANGAYQIIGIAPGVYTEPANDLILSTSKPKFLVIGLEGAAKTIIEGSGNGGYGWQVLNAAVISSLTFRRWGQALWANAPGQEIRLVDLVVRDNVNHVDPGAVDIAANAKVYVVGSSFIDNVGGTSYGQIYVRGGATATLLNTVIWGQGTVPMLGTASNATLVTNHCLVKDQTLTGTGNLDGDVNPKLRSDAHLLWDSPLRGAGASVAQSRTDMDGELRPSSAPDIGADQFNDSDSDELADQWELDYAGNLTTLTSRTQDADDDGLPNEGEYANQTSPLVADTDDDGVSDNDEVVLYGSNPLVVDTDGDDMPDGWEATHGLALTVRDAFEDKDGDGYPNIFEFARGSDAADMQSRPTPNFVVDINGGGTHTSVSAAVSASNISNGSYQIIGIAPGVYPEATNDLILNTSKPKFLMIGLEGAANTVIEGSGGGGYGWQVLNAAVISSLTFRRWGQALWANAPGQEIRLVDLVVRDNVNPVDPGAVDIAANAKVYVVGSTFIDNVGGSSYGQIYVRGGATATISNTVVWGQGTGLMLGKASNASLVTNHCLVKGQTLTGAGNIDGNVAPKLRSDAHLLWDSPLRGAGESLAQSLFDMDGELRPSSSARDIGADQFNDSDNDDLADQWELDYAGNLTTLTSRTQDADSDGLSNESEYVNRTNPLVVDTDGDGVSDNDEVVVHGSNPLVSDTDGDDMPDGWEIVHGLAPTVRDAFEDKDGDGYPNIFEFARGSDAADMQSIPTPNFLVDINGGGTHTSVSAAVSASNVSNGSYQIIGIAPGVYPEATNDLILNASKPKFLIIGLEGAAKTVVEGSGNGGYGWQVLNAAVISSLTFRRWGQALWANAPGQEIRLVDLIVHDNVNPVDPGAVDVAANSRVYVVGSTFIENVGGTSYGQIFVGGGATATILNTVVWGQGSGLMFGKASNATLVINHCLIKGQTLAGDGNLDGNVDPKLRSDFHLRSDSPLRGAGGAVVQSRMDVDGELRPASAPDIGVDQYNDADADGLPDSWEIENAGSLGAVTGGDDEDLDGLSNVDEYDLETDWLDSDTDGDLVLDGIEVEIGTNPLLVDSDDLADDLNGDRVLDSIGVQLGHQPTQLDSDGDGVSNTDERLMCTDPLRSDTDGDGVADNLDTFPHDPLMSTFPSDPEDETPPVITLESPWYAVEQ